SGGFSFALGDGGANFAKVMYPGSELSNRLRTVVSSSVTALLMACVLPATSATNATHWAFQPLVRPTVPASKHTNAIDAFVSSSLKSKGHTLATVADR